MERVSVYGATIKEIGHAISFHYFDLGAPVDILLVAGLNDVAAGRSAIEIMCDLTMLLEAIQVNLPGSTLSVATVPLPPKLCRLRGDRSWRPASFVDRTSTLVSLNARIIHFNRVNARSVGAAHGSAFPYQRSPHTPTVASPTCRPSQHAAQRPRPQVCTLAREPPPQHAPP